MPVTPSRLSASALLACLLAAPSVDARKRNVRTQIEEKVHVIRPLSKVEDKRYSQFEPVPGVTADRISFATGYYLRVPAIVYHPAEKHRSRHPAVVLLSKLSDDKTTPYIVSNALALARAGAVVLTFDPLGEFERHHLRMSNTRQSSLVPLSDDLALRLAGLRLEDILQSVHYLASRKDVNRHRMALVDAPGGIFAAQLACAVEPRLHACVLAPVTNPHDWDETDQRAYSALTFLGDRNAELRKLQTSHASCTDAPQGLEQAQVRWLASQLKLTVSPPTPQQSLSRASLHALPESVWSEDRDHYLFENWESHARAAIRAGAP